MSIRPCVSADPGVQFGRPCIDGTRIPAEVIAELVAAGEAVEAVMEMYELSRGQVLVACWYYARHGAGDGYGLRTQVRQTWRKWAEDNHRRFAGFDDEPVPAPPPLAKESPPVPEDGGEQESQGCA